MRKKRYEIYYVISCHNMSFVGDFSWFAIKTAFKFAYNWFKKYRIKIKFGIRRR